MKKKWIFLIFVLAIHLFLLLNLSFTSWPEMTSFPYLMNHGFKLYTDAVYVYPPALVVFLSLFFKIFGFGIWSVKAVAWIILLSSDIILFFLIKNLTKDEKKAFAFTLLYVLIQSFLEGNSIWLDTAIVPFLLLGALLAFKEKYFWSGVFFGASFLIKQTGLFFIFGIGLYLFWKERKYFLNFLKGIAIPLLFLVFYLLINRNFLDFFNWNFYFPLVFWGDYPGYIRLYLTKKELFLMVLFLCPLVFFKFKDFFENKKIYLKLIFLLGISIIAIFPRFSYLHFQVTLPFVVLFFAFVLRKSDFKKILVGGMIISIVLGSYFVFQNPGIFKGASRFYGQEEIVLSENLKKYLNKGDGLYLSGVHSGLYVLTESLPPKPWLDNFGWYFEIPGIQEKVIKRWSENYPKYIVWQKLESGNWYDLGVYRPQKITDWIFENYVLETELDSKTQLYLKK